MAIVPHSAKTTQALKDAAAKPFNDKMAETVNFIRHDDQLLRLINIDVAGVEQTDLAERLYKLNPDWVRKWYAAVTVHFQGVCFELEVIERPSPSHNNKRYVYNFDDEGKFPRKGEIFEHFMEISAPYWRAKEDKAQIEKAIDAVVEATPNLQRACEVMPAISNWMPDDVRARYNAPKARKAAKRASAEEIKANVLTPEALAALARSRMV